MQYACYSTGLQMKYYYFYYVVDAMLTLNPDYKWKGVPRRCSGNTFSSRSEDSTGGLSSSLPPATAPSHLLISDVIKHAALQVMILHSFWTTQPSLLLFHVQHLRLQDSFPHSPLPAEPPLLPLLSGLLTSNVKSTIFKDRKLPFCCFCSKKDRM